MVIANEDNSSSGEFDDSLSSSPPSPIPSEMPELVQQLEDYTPTVPGAITSRYLMQAGFSEIDPRIARIISVAAQKFIADIANDALQHCKTRTSNSQHSGSHGHGSNKDKKPKQDRKYVLSVEDLTPAMADHGLTMRKPQYFV